MRKHREIIFIMTGILLLLLIVGFIVYSMNFLVENIKVVLNQESSKTQGPLRPNLEGLKKLGIIK